MPGEYGQVNSYAIGMKIITPSGEVVEIGEDDPDLLQAARSSYGLFGIITEATFRVRPLRAMAVHHEVFTVDEFAKRLPELVAREQSMMLYVLPFVDKIVVEFRVYLGDEADARTRSLPYRAGWKVRNFAWKTVAPTLGYAAERAVPSDRLAMARGPVLPCRRPADVHAPRPGRTHDPDGSDDPLSARRRTLQVHVQHLGLCRGSLRRNAARVLQVGQGVLPAHRLAGRI